MTSPEPQNQNRSFVDPQIPRGETVASFETYREAQQAVDRLAQADFPVKRISIIGDGLKSVERVTGKLSYGRAAGAGALSGAWLGLFFGLLLVLVNPASDFVFVGAAVLIGAAFGMMFGIVSYSVNRRRRDFTSVMQVIATSYAVIAPPDIANRARNLLDGDGREHPAL
ncbi:magnesium transporter [Okibacterium endophyticum]